MKEAQELCRAIYDGVIKQNANDDRGLFTTGNIELQNAHDKLKEARESDEEFCGADENYAIEGEMAAYADVSGKTILPGMVKQARKDEIEYVKEHKVYAKVSVEECRKVHVTGKNPIEAGWIDVNKQDDGNQSTDQGSLRRT